MNRTCQKKIYNRVELNRIKYIDQLSWTSFVLLAHTEEYLYLMDARHQMKNSWKCEKNISKEYAIIS